MFVSFKILFAARYILSTRKGNKPVIIAVSTSSPVSRPLSYVIKFKMLLCYYYFLNVCLRILRIICPTMLTYVKEKQSTNFVLPCSHVTHPLCLNEYIIGNFAFKLIDNFVTPFIVIEQ